MRVNEEDKCEKWYACYDFEAYQKNFDANVDDDQVMEEGTSWNNVHVPVSFSVGSNLDGAETFHVSDKDPAQLVSKLVGKLLEIAMLKYDASKTRFRHIFHQLDDMREAELERLDEVIQDVQVQGMDLEELMNDDVEIAEDGSITSEQLKVLEKLYGKLEGYCQELGVFGFNSAGYDVKLIKQYLFKELCERGEQPSFTVKKAGKYPCIKTEHLKFLDILQFLAPGYNLKSFFKAFGVSEQKGYFPYDYFTDANQLDERTLPPYEAFYSSLKHCNVLEEEYDSFQKLLDQGKTEQEALQTLRLIEKPKTGPQNYDWLHQLWREKEWTTFADYLKWYNDLDVTPMISAIDNMNNFYKERKIDFIHQAISLPGIAMRVCFDSVTDPNAEFHLFNNKNKDIYKLFKDNIVGRPSIIFNRHHEAGKTFIRNNLNKPCEQIVGYDANALYLWAIGQPMPSGYPLIRREQNFFVREFPEFAGECRDWIDWIAHEHNIEIQSSFHGGEKRIGKYKVDGYCQEQNKVFEFHGDYWHAHPSMFPDENALHPSIKHKDQTPKIIKEVREYDREKLEYLEGKGYTVEIIWEHQWRALVDLRPEIKAYLCSQHCTTHWDKYLTKEETISKVQRGSLFGFIECDVQVPESLRKQFEEMTSIFKNTEVNLKDIGEFMREYAKEHNIKDTPRRLLIGSYFGEKIGLSTPLLQWYLNKGLVVTRIYTVVEYIPNAAFQDFATQVAQARLEGDRDPAKALMAEMNKLIGNSSYGRTITNKEKHHDIHYVNDRQIGEYIMDNHFYGLTELPGGYYEIEQTKSSIVLDLPIHIGVFILNYAKLRMLEFYCDFMDHYLSHDDFEYVEMDTGSAYLGIAGQNVEDLVKEELREEFEKDKANWLVTPTAPQGKRTPGLFKVEFKGDKIIGLCSQSYCTERFASESKPGEVKFSMKGVNKGQFKNPMEHYERVLVSKENFRACNEGIRAKGQTMAMYRQWKNALTYFYPKRKVLEDGRSTLPLDI